MRLRTLAYALLAVSCGVETPTPEAPRAAQPDATDNVALTNFSDCAALEQHIEELSVLEMQTRVEQNKQYARQSWHWTHGGGGGSGSGAFADAGASAAGGNGSQPTDYTTTNTQLAGVDEPDIIKNDGTRLFVVSGRKLFATSTWPASELRTRGSVAIGGRPFEMFLEGNRVVVFSHVIEQAFGVPAYCAQNPGYCERWYSNATQITWLDVSNLDALDVVWTQRVPGRYQSARRVGDALRLVSTDAMNALEIQTWVPWEQQQAATSLTQLERLHDQLAASNERLLRLRTLSMWLPSEHALDCSAVWKTNASSRLGVTHITSLSLSDPTSFVRQSLIASVDMLYQGDHSLYLAQRHWWWWTAQSQPDSTYVYKFDLAQPARVEFIAAGRVDGAPVNQFAFDEQRGKLRVATTTTTGAFQTVNRVVVLEARGTTLTKIGTTPDLAPGERIMSARFMGDRGYVVTFREIDPLYTLDLSDDTNPRVVGELKIPGFSSYLHPLGDTHLLTIGTFIPEPPAATWERHLQLQIFDVSDPANPRQTHTQLVGEAWGWSEAQWNHKAFNYFPARGLLAVPFADWHEARLVSDLRVFHVDAVTGFTSKGALDMRDVVQRSDCDQSGCWSWYWEPMVRRSVLADDFVYAITSGGVRAAHLDALNQPVATAVFEPAP